MWEYAMYYYNKIEYMKKSSIELDMNGKIHMYDTHITYQWNKLKYTSQLCD